VAFRAVLFDWRGTLVVSPTFAGWAAEALRRLGSHLGDRDRRLDLGGSLFDRARLAERHLGAGDDGR